MNEKLIDKERRAVRLLRSLGGQPVELSYSGGKDSDVILHLAREAGLNYRAIYKNTTIDPPGTIRHCLDAGAEIMRPKVSFFGLIAQRGFPTRFSRFCCEALKEYKVMDNAIHGIRRAESTARAKRYKEPIICRTYGKKDRVNVFLPILEWMDADVAEYVTQNAIKCHPLYYDDQGRFHPERRLGCMGCPLRTDNGLAEFIKNPALARAWLRAGQRWADKPREGKRKPVSLRLFADIYENFFFHLFAGKHPHPYQWFLERKHTLFGTTDFKQALERILKADLTL